MPVHYPKKPKLERNTNYSTFKIKHTTHQDFAADQI